MMRSGPFTRLLPCLPGLVGLPLTLSGCVEWKGVQHSPQKATTSVVQAAELPPEQPPMAEQTRGADLHQAETVAQVLDFVDRLGAASAASEDPTLASRDADVARSSARDESRGPSAMEQSPRPAKSTAMTPNAPADVAASPSPGPRAASASGGPGGQAGADQAATAVTLPAVPVIESVFIRGGELDQEADQPDTSASAANGPLSTDVPEQAQTLEGLIGALAERVNSAPEDVSAHWKLRLLQLVVGDERAAREPSKETAADSAGLLRELVDVIVATRDALQDPVTGAGPALAAASALQTRLAEQADLQIPTVALCTRVQTFGVYDEMPAAALIPGRANRAIVYLEIANFSSEETPAGQYRTALRGELEVLTATGTSVWRHEEPNIVDLSRQRRHDFFLAQLVTLPGALGPGEYVLKVTVQDESSGKSNQAIHAFTMGTSAVANAGP